MKLRRLFASVMAFLLVICFATTTTVYAAERLPDENYLYRPTDIIDEATGTEQSSSIDEVPLYWQNDEEWKNIRYGNVYLSNGRYATIGSHGCGPTCLAMVATYLLDKEYTPVDAVEEFGSYNTAEGSYWILFEDSAEKLGLELQERTYQRETVMDALANGQVVISLQHKGLFTGGGHFIVLTGLNDEGKIMVNDPNGKNYEKETLKDGFENGFTEQQVFSAGGPYWIYELKYSEDLFENIVEEDKTVEFAKTKNTNIHNTIS